jgi:hypothetical protein
MDDAREPMGEPCARGASGGSRSAQMVTPPDTSITAPLM